VGKKFGRLLTGVGGKIRRRGSLHIWGVGCGAKSEAIRGLAEGITLQQKRPDKRRGRVEGGNDGEARVGDTCKKARARSANGRGAVCCRFVQ